VTEQEMDDRDLDDTTRRCPACGTRNGAGDRYCAQCGALLPPHATDGELPPGATASVSPATGESPPARNADQSGEKPESAAWLLAARPAAVIGGGFVLLLLAAALLTIGQLESTGTIVMLSICLTPLALLTLLIGLARLMAARTRG
jgi:hypothetical protein